MNWKEHPHLFANGKFEFLVEKHNNQKYIVSSYSPHNNSLVLRVRGTNEKTSVGLSDITLIARPISDMSDEEMRQLPNLDESSSREMIDWYKEALKDKRGIGISSIDFLRLLSIGVYPFDQSHFGDTVIDKTEAL